MKAFGGAALPGAAGYDEVEYHLVLASPAKL